VSERNRLALELHDAISQKLFALVLTAESVATLLERDTGAARGHVDRLQELARQALEELRSLIFELRPPDLEKDGLGGALRKHVEVLQRLYPAEIALSVAGDMRALGATQRDRAIMRIAQEALQNALRHSGAGVVTVRLAASDGCLVLEVEDDGTGFEPDDPELRSRHLGLTSMEERARQLDGRLEIRSARGAGTIVRFEAELD
jgi:signal transduction histidine kinase